MGFHWSRHFPLRLALFLACVGVTWQVPGGWKWLPLLAALPVGIWSLMALSRDLGPALDWLLARRPWQRILGFFHPRWRGWKIVFGACAAILLLVGIFRAWPSWHFLATSSLREDEILNIAQYTSRGFDRAMTNYSLARNHILYNVINSLLPGSSSTWPPRARLVSLVSVSGGLFLLLVYAAGRGWLLPAAFFVPLLALNLFATKTLLEARGYGLIFFFAILACVGFAEWTRTHRRGWLTVLAVATVGGAYTLPYFIVFGGALMVMAWASRPSRETFFAGILAAVALGMLYLPIARDVLQVAVGYGEEYANQSTVNFSTIEGFLRILQFFIPYDVLELGAGGFALCLAAVLAFTGAFAKPHDRLTAASVTVALLGLAAFFFTIGSVPIRTAAFTGGAQALVATLLLGTLFGARILRSGRPLIQLTFAVCAGIILWNATPRESLIPRQDWRSIGEFLDRSIPPQTPIWAFKSYRSLIQWNLPGHPEIEKTPLSSERIAAGKLVAVDGEVHDRHEARRPGWKDFPPDVRFVTFPLLLNYQRVYFCPVQNAVPVEWNGKVLPSSVPGRQRPDPALLESSGGHGDTLLKSAPDDGEPWAAPTEIPLPATLVVNLDNTPMGGFLNMLFTQAMSSRKISADWEDHEGRWHPAGTPRTFGESLSIPIPPKRARALRVTISQESHSSQNRPAFGLLAAWVTN